MAHFGVLPQSLSLLRVAQIHTLLESFLAEGGPTSPLEGHTPAAKGGWAHTSSTAWVRGYTSLGGSGWVKSTGGGTWSGLSQNGTAIKRLGNIHASIYQRSLCFFVVCFLCLLVLVCLFVWLVCFFVCLFVPLFLCFWAFFV